MRLTVCAAALLAATNIAAPPAEARKGAIIGYVVAHSDFGRGSVRGPVRETSKGLQVRLPGGTWVHCPQLCSETLRIHTVDFWESYMGGKRGGGTRDVSIFGRPLRYDIYRY